MTWISEINFRGGGIASDGEFVEVTLAPGDDPADFSISLYDQNGELHIGSGLAGGEVTLDTLTGIPHPDDPAYTIYNIPAGIKNYGTADGNEALGVSLTNTDTGEVLTFYSAAATGPITATEGAANGAVSENSLDHLEVPNGSSVQYAQDGTRSIATISEDDSVLCLSTSALVRTAHGPVPAGALEAGMLVWTFDHGMQPLQWVGHSTVQPDRDGPPIHVKWGEGPGLVVSGQHRILLRSAICERMYGTPEVLVAAKKLIGTPGISALSGRAPLPIIHLLFQRHEIIEADGTLCESLYLGAQTQQILTGPRFAASMAPARPFATGKKLRQLLDRHAKNNKPLFIEQHPARQPALLCLG